MACASKPGTPSTPSERPLGVALTNHDGSYHIDLRGDGTDAACCECPEVYLKLRDRDCRLIYDGCADRRCCEPGQPLRIDVALAPQALWWHLSRPLSWERIDEPLVPVRVMQEIEDALELLHAGGLPPDLASLRLAVCATPPIEGFDRLLQDAWGALQGDPQAAQRYRDVLDALCGTEQSCCGEHAPFAAEVDALFDGACAEPPATDCKEPEPCAPCTPEHCAEGAVRLRPAVHLRRQGAAARDGGAARGLRQAGRRQALLAGAARPVLPLRNARCAARRIAARRCSATTRQKRMRATCSSCCASNARPAHDKSSCTPRHPPGCCVPCLDPKLARCLREAIEHWCRIHCYHVCEVRPPRACPGDEILIVGCGFGDRPGRVVFRARAARRRARRSWPRAGATTGSPCVVPQGAGCGLWLELPPTTIAVCDRFLELRPIGCIDKGFEGTSAEILRFDVKDHTAGECPLQPGEPLRIRWNTCAADRVRVELIDLANNGVIAAQDPAALNGRWDFTATNFTRTVRMRVRITAFGRCEPPQVSRQIDLVFQKQPNLQIQGLEVTQAVQHYRADQHLTDPADRGADNSLRLVTNKTAWVRAYLRSGQDPAFDNGQLAGVNGTLRVERRVGGVWGTIANLAPQNGPIDRRRQLRELRRRARQHQHDAQLRRAGQSDDRAAALHRGRARAVCALPRPRGEPLDADRREPAADAERRVHHRSATTGRTRPAPATSCCRAPTLATCQAETSWAMTTYPVSGATERARRGHLRDQHADRRPAQLSTGCCSPNWGPLLTQIGALVALDQAANPGQTWVYYGIIASGIPVNVPGCSGSAAGGVAGQPLTYAHEIGHQFGLPHARCGNAGNGNAAYPVYEPYDLPVDPPGTTNWTMASIGEYGLDINNGAIANPNDFEDFMSYCGPRWISKFTYDFLTNIAQLTPVVVPSGAAGAPRIIEDRSPGFEPDALRIAPFIHVMGTIGAGGAVEVASVARIDTRYLRGDGRQTGYVAQLLDADGRMLAEDVLYAYASDGGCGGHRPPADCHCDDCARRAEADAVQGDAARHRARRRACASSSAARWCGSARAQPSRRRSAARARR